MKQQRHIRSNQERDQFIQNLQKWDFVRGPMTFTYEPYKENKTREQEKKYHAMIRDIAIHYDWMIAKKKRDMADWKLWLTAGFKKAKDESIDFVPSVDGEGIVMLGCSTSAFKTDEASEFIEYLYQLGTELEVEWSE